MLMAKRPHLSLLDHGPKERARLHSRLEKNGLGTVCIAGYNNFTADLEHGDIPHREIQIHYVTELARLAHDLGGNLVRIFTGYETAAASYSAMAGGHRRPAQMRSPGRGIRRDDRSPEPP